MAAQLPLGLRLPATARFDNFIPGDNHTVLRAVEQLATESQSTALYLAGGADTGKTHLLQAACRAVEARNLQAAYLPLAELVRYSPDCLEGLDQFALLALDDIDRCAGIGEWEEALFHLFNRLRESGGRWLAGGRQTPEGAQLQLADLRTRLGWGGVFVLQPASDDLIAQILTQRARERGLEMSAEIVRYLQVRSTRELTGLLLILDRLDHAALAAQRRFTIPFVRETLGLKPD